MRMDWTISALAHVGLLAAGLVSFGAKPLPKPPESLPVDLVSVEQLSQVTAGARQAPKAEAPKPLVEKTGPVRAVEDPAAKVSPQKEIAAARAEQPAPLPEPRPKPPQPKPAASEPPARAEPVKEARKPSEPKPDPIAEALRKDAAQKTPEPRPEAREPRVPAPRREEPRFDPAKVAALLDKRTPQRQEATGAALNPTPSLGLPNATAARLSQSEIDALRARLAQLWNPPVGARDPEELVVLVRVQLTRDGRVAAPPQVLTSGHSPLFLTARDSAIRALFRGQPYDMLRPETYEQWKDIEITFDPRDMMRG
jgi:colicin import membrane protein